MKVNGHDIGKPSVCGACGDLDHSRCAALHFETQCVCNDYCHAPDPAVVASVAAFRNTAPEAIEAAWSADREAVNA